MTCKDFLRSPNKAPPIPLTVLKDNELYLDCVFIEFNELPIYFSCVSNNQYYLGLCCDFDNQNYVVVESSAKEISEMLNGKISMRSTFSCKTKHWVVTSGEDTSSDEITLINAPYLEEDVLPKEGAKYTVATKKVKQYLSRIENESKAINSSPQTREVLI